jgi:hypothetical protein
VQKRGVAMSHIYQVGDDYCSITTTAATTTTVMIRGSSSSRTLQHVKHPRILLLPQTNAEVKGFVCWESLLFDAGYLLKNFSRFGARRGMEMMNSFFFILLAWGLFESRKGL